VLARRPRPVGRRPNSGRRPFIGITVSPYWNRYRPMMKTIFDSVSPGR